MTSMIKEEQIKKKIEEITGKYTDINQQTRHSLSKPVREVSIKNILLISSSYNFFQIEEEGRLSSLFSEWKSFSDDFITPVITQVETGVDAINKIKKESFDLIIIFNKPVDTSIESLSFKIKDKTQAPIALLDNNVKELDKIASNANGNIDKFFTWNGDGKIIVSIVHYFEDKINIEHTDQPEKASCILLIEDSIQSYSSYLTLINEEICSYFKKIINESLSNEQKKSRYNQRPFILHTSTIQDSKNTYEKHKNQISFIISDNFLKEKGKQKRIGVEIANKAFNNKPSIPVFIQSSDKIKTSELTNSKIKTITKSAPDLLIKIRKFIRTQLGPNNIVFHDKNGKDIYHLQQIQDINGAITELDDVTFSYCLKEHRLSKWLKSIGELGLSKQCYILEQKTYENSIKIQLQEILENYSYSINQASITHFSRKIDDPNIKITRIGSGALGGKARGIAFIAKILSKYLHNNPFPDLKITIPRSIVLSTEVFDYFVKKNDLHNLDFTHLSDERISAKFMKTSLPPTILGDLRAFIRNTRKPLIARSSGLLEDSLMQPFAGIYSSMLLPNDSWETDLRFQEVCNAIKHVYASTYFDQARTYIRSTTKHIGDEKMAVLIQEVVGTKKEKYFYPTISGVAKSYNYYPSGSCNAEDGIAYLALGLGKSIVDGGNSFAFCPNRPKSPLYGTAKDYMKHSQNKFYALNIQSIYKYVNYNEDTSLDKLDINIARKYGVLDKTVSTYVLQDDRLYPGIYDEGSIVVDFAPILNLNVIPLAKAIKLLLEISKIVLGCAVEIEFAVNIPTNDSEVAELVILQIRNMVSPQEQIHFNRDEIPSEDIILDSKDIMGHIIISDISDIIYVDQDHFDLSKSVQIVDKIRKKNEELMDKKTPYILIGPGRWGSSDPWLGIPVTWSNIAGTCAIVETPYKQRHIDPSQGSHFFHDMMASKVAYLITKKQDDINWNWIKNQKLVESSELMKHVKTKVPLTIIVDSTKGCGVIIKNNKGLKRSVQL